MAFLFRENRRHLTAGPTDGQGTISNVMSICLEFSCCEADTVIYDPPQAVTTQLAAAVAVT